MVPPLQRLTALPGELTDAAWDLIAPLLPTATTTGRPRSNQRRVLAGILWVMHTGVAWQDVPACCGSAATANNACHRWRTSGLWTKILAVLHAPYLSL